MNNAYDPSKYITDQFGMSFYTLPPHKFHTEIELYKTVVRRGPNGHVYHEQVERKNIDTLKNRIDIEFDAWVKYVETANWYDRLRVMPRTPKEVVMIQKQLDGVVGWWNESSNMGSI